MSKEDREQHRRDVAAFYKQQGVPEERLPRRYRDADPTPEQPTASVDPENPYAGVDRSRLTAQQNEMLDFAQELAASRGQWGQPEHTKAMLEFLANQRGNASTPTADTPTENPRTPPQKGSSVSHKEEIINSLVAARTEVEVNVGGRARQALSELETALAAVASTEQGITSAAGYTAGAYGTDSSLAIDLQHLSSDLQTTVELLRAVRDGLESYVNAASQVTQNYTHVIEREQAVGQ